MTGNSSPPREGDHSPWGLIETATPIADGIVCVHTLSHGGIWLSEARLAQMSPEERSSDGWYEEDCEAAWPLRRFRDEVLHAFPAHTLDPFIDATISSSGDSFASIAMNRSPDMQLPTDEEADREVLDNIIAAIEAMNWAHETTAESVRRVNSILHEHEEGYRNEAQWNRIAMLLSVEN